MSKKERKSRKRSLDGDGDVDGVDRTTTTTNRTVVLEEDDYALGLQSVIAREFYPELQRLRDAQEYLQAEREENVQLMMEIRV